MGGSDRRTLAAAWAVARRGLRRRVWATVALAVLATLAGGVVIAAVAGARRTGSAMDRLVAYSRPEHLYVQTADSATAEKVAALPQVADSDRFPFIFLSRTADGTDAGWLVSFAAADERAFRTMNRNLVLHGHQARVDDPAELMVNERAARHLRLRVGSSVTLHAYSLDQVQSSADTGGLVNAPPAGPAFAFQVVGVVRAPADVNPGADNDVVSYLGRDVVVMTPAFLRAYAAGLGTRPDDLPGMEGVRIRLRHGLADLDAFTAAARPVIGDQGQILTGSDTAAAAVAVKRATRFQAVALLAFAGLAALAGLLIVGQPCRARWRWTPATTRPSGPWA